MTALEKQMKVKSVLKDACKRNVECIDCTFCNRETFDCGIRDNKKLIPADENWNMESAMIGD